MDPVVQSNRRAWAAASEKYVREREDPLAQAARGSLRLASELDLLRPLMESCAALVHLQSGNGLDDIGLVATGARVVIGVHFSAVAARAARRRATQLGVSCQYGVGGARSPAARRVRRPGVHRQGDADLDVRPGEGSVDRIGWGKNRQVVVNGAAIAREKFPSLTSKGGTHGTGTIFHQE